MHPCVRCGQKPSHALLRWGMVLVLGCVLEAESIASKRHSHTLSHATRSVFRTHGRPGQVAFTCVWVGFGAWFFNHILRGGPKVDRP